MTKIENTLAEEIYTALKNNNPLSPLLEDKTFTELTDTYIYVMYQQVKEQKQLRDLQLEYRMTKIHLVESDEYLSMFKTIKARENQAMIDTEHLKKQINMLESSIAVYETMITLLKIYIDNDLSMGDCFIDLTD